MQKKRKKLLDIYRNDLSRRDLFSSTSVLTILTTSVLAACKSKAIKKQAPFEIAKKDPEATKIPTTHITPSTATDDCANSKVFNYNKAKDIEGAKIASQNLQTVLRFYGDSSRATIVVGLPLYTNYAQTLDSISLFRPNGDLLCKKKIETNSDIGPHDLLLPVVFENISLKSDKTLTVLLAENLSSGEQYSKFEMKEAITFENTFQGKPVKSSSDPLFSSYKPFISLTVDTSRNFTREMETRVSSVDKNVVFMPVSGLRGYIISSMLGENDQNQPPQQGDTFVDFLGYKRFICYKLTSDGKYYVRTIISLF